ncbi:transcription factor grauzone-like isoform X2 [Eurosta solidaginis]|uniref:transcription factor grauzone-like isoform X2 n=1 Tax=Eurosta solidaginis TaxID=178769 RepID=UPI0035312A05
MLCMLCINDSDHFLKIFDKDGEQLKIADILGRHFWFKPQPDDQPSTAICSICWLKVNDFHQFYTTIEETHNKLTNQVKKESSFGAVTNEFLHHRNEFVDIKEEESNENIACDLVDDESGSEALNPLCELDCNSNEDVENEDICEKKDQSNAEKSKATKTLFTNPARKKRKYVAEKSPPKRAKHASHKDIVNVDVKPVEDQPEKLRKSDKSKEKQGVKSKQEDDEMVKKYIQMNCELCAYVSEDYPTLRKHFRLQHSSTKAFIRCCNKKLFHRLEIIHHAYKHHDPEFFKCKICQKHFSEQSTLSRHMIATHAPEEECNFHCDQCPKKFARQKQLEFHRNSHVPMEERTFICDQCPNSRFASKDLLNIHMCMRHKRAVNVCHVCAKEIRDKASFERHVSAHFEECGPKVKCPYENCDHWLKDERNLGRHIRRVHTAENKAMTCDECGRECKNKSALSKHKHRVHSGIVFTCEQCKKNFKRAIYLREHMAQHTGEILYKCPFCTRTFNSNANMHAHKKKLHPVEWDNWRKTNNGSLQQLSRQLDKSSRSIAKFNQ